MKRNKLSDWSKFSAGMYNIVFSTSHGVLIGQGVSPKTNTAINGKTFTFPREFDYDARKSSADTVED